MIFSRRDLPVHVPRHIRQFIGWRAALSIVGALGLDGDYNANGELDDSEISGLESNNEVRGVELTVEVGISEVRVAKINDPLVTIIDIKSGVPIHKGELKLLTGSSDFSVKYWDVGQPVRSVLPNSAPVMDVRFLRDGIIVRRTT